ncbi:MAG: hypothetical protein RL215_2893, partial [Planctomycetota bacterium]
MGLLAGTVFDRPPHCERCERLETECVCPPPEVQPRALVRLRPDGRGPIVRVGVEKRKHGRSRTSARGCTSGGGQTHSVSSRSQRSQCGGRSNTVPASRPIAMS